MLRSLRKRKTIPSYVFARQNVPWKAPRSRLLEDTSNRVKSPLLPPVASYSKRPATRPQNVLAWGIYQVDGNRGAGVAHLFVARGARRVDEVRADNLEEQQLLQLSRSEIEAALTAGEFKVLAWATVVALGLRYLDPEQRKRDGS